MEISEIEVFLLEPDRSRLAEWLAERLGEIQLVDDDDNIQMFRAASGPRITVTPNVEDGPFTSLLFTGSGIPWINDLECCRDVARALGVVTRCAPEDQDQRDLWVQVTGNKETQVPWSAPPESKHDD